jgi:hypothetical protein
VLATARYPNALAPAVKLFTAGGEIVHSEGRREKQKAHGAKEPGVPCQYARPQAILPWLTERWLCEVVNFYLKVQLELADFRIWRYEAVDKHVVAAHPSVASLSGPCPGRHLTD